MIKKILVAWVATFFMLKTFAEEDTIEEKVFGTSTTQDGLKFSATVSWDDALKEYIIDESEVANTLYENVLATGTFDLTTLNQSGWNQLKVVANLPDKEEISMEDHMKTIYAMGLIEGKLTCQEIQDYGNERIL